MKVAATGEIAGLLMRFSYLLTIQNVYRMGVYTVIVYSSYSMNNVSPKSRLHNKIEKQPTQNASRKWPIWSTEAQYQLMEAIQLDSLVNA